MGAPAPRHLLIIAPKKDSNLAGPPPPSEPELDEIKKAEQVEVFAVTDIDRGHLSVRCKMRLVIPAGLNDAAETAATVRPTREKYLLVEPGPGSVIEHSHGWDGGRLPDPDTADPGDGATRTR
jgi:hypothetical protein